MISAMDNQIWFEEFSVEKNIREKEREREGVNHRRIKQCQKISSHPIQQQQKQTNNKQTKHNRSISIVALFYFIFIQ